MRDLDADARDAALVDGGDGAPLPVRCRFDLKVDGREELAMTVGVQDGATFAEIEHPDRTLALRVESDLGGVARHLAGRAPGIPATVTADGKRQSVIYRNGELLEPSTNKVWRPPPGILEPPIFRHPLVFPRPFFADSTSGSDQASSISATEAAELFRRAGGYAAVTAALFGACGHAATGDEAGAAAGIAIGATSGATFGAAACLAENSRRGQDRGTATRSLDQADPELPNPLDPLIRQAISPLITPPQ
jgi:hypothetical protein